MKGGKHIIPNQPFVNYDGILKVVTLPRHKGHLKVSPKGELSVASSIAFGKDIAFFNYLALGNNGC